MNHTLRREMLMTKVIPFGDENPTYLVQIRLGYNWSTYDVSPYNHGLLSMQGSDERVSMGTLTEDNEIMSITISGQTFDVHKMPSASR